METVLQNLCEAHAERAQVTALVTNEGRNTIQEVIWGVRVIRARCICTPLSVPIAPAIIRWLRRIEADVVIHHEPNPVALLSCLWVRPVTPLVIWFHSDIVRQRAFYGAYRPLLRLGMRRALAIVVASPNHVRYTPILQEFADKCCVVPYGICLGQFAWSSEAEARVREIRAASGLPIVLFVGRLAYYKGVEYLLDAMEEVEARLILVGAGPLEGALRERAARVMARGRIEFAGQLSDEDVAAHLHACDVFVLPSVERSEAFGVVQIEAMACGKPVVSCRIPSGVPWVNQDGVTGLTVPPGDPRSLADAINRLLADPAMSTRLGENGRARVRREFTVERMGEAFWQVLTAAREGRVVQAFRYDPRHSTAVV